MTLVPYDPDRLDQLALRFLDLAAQLRALAQSCREQGIEPKLHEGKALEWLDKLEGWMIRTQKDAHLAAYQTRGKKMAQRAARPEKSS